MKLHEKIITFIIAFLCIYSLGCTLFIISIRSRYNSDVQDYERKIASLTETIERITETADRASLGLERAIGEITASRAIIGTIQERTRAIEKLTGAIREAITELIGIVQESYGTAPEN